MKMATAHSGGQLPRPCAAAGTHPQIPADAALVFWVDELDQHRACVVRRQGAPTWVALRGSGQQGSWSEEDAHLPRQALLCLQAEFLPEEERQALLNTNRESDRPFIRAALDPRQGQRLLTALQRQRLAPLEPHLKGVKHLLVVPADRMAAVPVEVLTDRYSISYVPSGSIYARQMEAQWPLKASSLLVLADPVFTHKPESDLLALSRGNKDWAPLPGMRLEARTLGALVPDHRTLLGSEASEQKLAELAATKQLRRYRLLHLATHGEVNPALPRETALILAQDNLPTPDEAAKMVLAGKKPLTGRLTVDRILAEWQLDADLVVLSACQTGLGTHTPGVMLVGTMD
jgi:CHAT domain-containing protein